MNVAASFRVPNLAVALAFAGALAFVQPASAGAADQKAAVSQADRGNAASKRVDAQIARLARAIRITDAQKPQWEALVAAMRENARLVQLSRADRAKIHPTDTIDALYADRRETQAKLARLERVIPAAEALYAVLSDTQKQRADALFGGLRMRHDAVIDTGN